MNIEIFFPCYFRHVKIHFIVIILTGQPQVVFVRTVSLGDYDWKLKGNYTSTPAQFSSPFTSFPHGPRFLSGTAEGRQTPDALISGVSSTCTLSMVADVYGRGAPRGCSTDHDPLD